ncbi:MAG: NIPSNAP family protein [Candidatus Harrisonbacteria bacterium]|nr:NIPSNAP family protein [Candidatus Harrisonbacteria bacterium]
MIIVHDTFICKPGSAGKMAKLFKEVMGDHKDVLHIMTDMTGQWHRVIVVSQYEDLKAYQENWEKHEKDTEERKRMDEMMAGTKDMHVSGSREIYKVW